MSEDVIERIRQLLEVESEYNTYECYAILNVLRRQYEDEIEDELLGDSYEDDPDEIEDDSEEDTEQDEEPKPLVKKPHPKVKQ